MTSDQFSAKGPRLADGLLKAISGAKRRSLVTWIAVMYAIPVFVFAVLYLAAGVLLSNGVEVRDFGQALFFSLVTQATVGYGDITPQGGGRILASAQIVIGLAWMAFLPAIALIRLTQPDTRSLRLSSRIVFNPDTARFTIRYASFSKLTVFHTEVTVWVRTLADAINEYNNNPVRVRSAITMPRRFLNIRTGRPLIVHTDAAGEFPEFPQDDVCEVLLHPGHMRRGEDDDQSCVMVDISGDTTIGSINVFHEYWAADIICGSHVSVQPTPGGPKSWNQFDRVQIRTDTPEGTTYCRESCRFRPHCELMSKK